MDKLKLYSDLAKPVRCPTFGLSVSSVLCTVSAYSAPSYSLQSILGGKGRSARRQQRDFERGDSSATCRTCNGSSPLTSTLFAHSPCRLPLLPPSPLSGSDARPSLTSTVQLSPRLPQRPCSTLALTSPLSEIPRGSLRTRSSRREYIPSVCICV
jgi:hypothetical protein